VCWDWDFELNRLVGNPKICNATIDKSILDWNVIGVRLGNGKNLVVVAVVLNYLGIRI